MVYDKNVAMELHSFLSRWGLLGKKNAFFEDWRKEKEGLWVSGYIFIFLRQQHDSRQIGLNGHKTGFLLSYHVRIILKSGTGTAAG